MDEDRFNISVRKFLKEVGVTSQRELEKAVRSATAAGKLRDGQKLHATMTLTVQGIDLTHVIDGELDPG